MKTASIALIVGIVGCAFTLLPATANAVKYTEKVLYSFGAAPDGEAPYAGVIDVKGTLYGTTYIGGDNLFGTVFALNRRTGAEKVLYSFEYEDGFPQADLIDVKGTLYGTASGGGDAQGAVFAFDLSTGAEKTVYTFCAQVNCADGYGPVAPLLYLKGTLYGTTDAGGSTTCTGGGCGVVFSLDRSTGAEKVLYSFCSQANCADGEHPSAGLIDVNGTLYGTTFEGGSHNEGTVFAVNATSGAETVVYSFCSQAKCADGVEPLAALIDVKGILYGTTYRGGNSGSGTLFSIDLATGAEKVLYSFCSQTNCADGAQPIASLIDVNGTLYGTTSGGGTACGGAGCGTVFSVDPTTGAEKVPYVFQGSTDGAFPFANLIDVKGNLYGTTYAGGADQTDCGSQGCGTVFVLKQEH